MTELTREQVLVMEAGPEFDALVEKHIFEREWVLYERVVINDQLWLRNTWMAPGIDYQNPPGGTHAGQCPPPRSTDIAAAMEALDEVVASGYYKIESGHDGETWVEIIVPGAEVRISADTRECAICRAALLVKLEEANAA